MEFVIHIIIEVKNNVIMMNIYQTVRKQVQRTY